MYSRGEEGAKRPQHESGPVREARFTIEVFQQESGLPGVCVLQDVEAESWEPRPDGKGVRNVHKVHRSTCFTARLEMPLLLRLLTEQIQEIADGIHETQESEG